MIYSYGVGFSFKTNRKANYSTISFALPFHDLIRVFFEMHKIVIIGMFVLPKIENTEENKVMSDVIFYSIYP